jgi:hypothetical protein
MLLTRTQPTYFVATAAHSRFPGAFNPVGGLIASSDADGPTTHQSYRKPAFQGTYKQSRADSRPKMTFEYAGDGDGD